MSIFEFAIDSAGNGLYSTDISARVLASLNVTCTRGKEQARIIAAMSAGSFNALALNTDREFSPGNTSSSVYGTRWPGKQIRWMKSAGAGSGLALEPGGGILLEDGSGVILSEGLEKRVIWTGRLVNFTHHPEPEQRTFETPSLSMLSRLVGKNVSTGLYQNITTSAAIAVILDKAGWPADERIISTGQTVLANWWWIGDAFQGIQELLLSEGPGASVYDSPEGWFVFEDRDYRTTQSRCTMPQAVYSDTDIRVQPPFVYDENEENVIEACAITVQDRELQPLAEMWSLGSVLTLAADEVWKVRIKSGDPFLNAEVPDPTPSNTIWKFEGEQPLTSGDFGIEYLGQTTATALDWNASAGDFEAALESLSTIGSGNVSCTGGPLNTAPIYAELIGDFAGINVAELPEIVESTLNPVDIPGGISVDEVQPGTGTFYERQRLTPGTPDNPATLTGGTWDWSITWSLGSANISGLAYNITASDLADEINDGSTLSLVTCDGGPMNLAPIVVNIVDITENIENAEITLHDITMQTPGATVSVSQSQAGGIADYVVTAGAVASITLDMTDAVSTLLTITAGPGGATITGLRVRAQLMTVVRSQDVYYPEDVEERIAAGEEVKVYRPAVRAEMDRDTAFVICMLYVLYYVDPRPSVVVTLLNAISDPAAVFDIEDALAREVSDLITVENTHLGISENYFVERISHTLAGMVLLTTLECEKAMAA